MAMTIRPATRDDIPVLVPLLTEDVRQREALDGALWSAAADAGVRIEANLRTALHPDGSPVRHFWLVAERQGAEGKILGVAHAILLPVPPIYAGEQGMPGLIMEDCAIAQGVGGDVRMALLDAVEVALADAGARIILGSSVPAGAWAVDMGRRGYAALTHYYPKEMSDLSAPGIDVRHARESDVPGLVRASAENRETLFAIDAFWKPHPDADARFGAWMTKSLTLPDRDMFVADKGDGYSIAQPATALHLPAGHEISATGIIDDWYHAEMHDAQALANQGAASSALLRAAERALQTRNMRVAMVVCPAGWRSKRAVLERAGYHKALTWWIKRA
ncbi:GNAT family N-acetyltransferase [Cognatishimia sp. F0-27]|uniref:GNAT family N-acetyltransferase n=1 Tax=Cognatishimia sp. F0-27 TaxID=2816855 RepID=UPI001D0CAFA8|nr:hypothetical protein [Cognatishimia sp. F0-27]MCC1493008.1 hypothetical protein [Cognatishimia sp. F0-27]